MPQTLHRSLPLRIVAAIWRALDRLRVEEVERARSYVASQFAPSFQSVAGIANMVGDLVQYNLPASYFNSYTQSVLGVSVADVERVAKQYLGLVMEDYRVEGTERKGRPDRVVDAAAHADEEVAADGRRAAKG